MSIYQNVSAFILRLTLGIIFLVHGLVKFQSGLSNIAGWFNSIGLPSFLAYIVAIGELAGGILLIIGLFTRMTSAFFAIIMIGAIFTVKLPAGLLGNDNTGGYEFDLALLAMALSLVFTGSKWLALDPYLPFTNKETLSEADQTTT